MGVDDQGNKFELSPDPMADELKNRMGNGQLGNTESIKNNLKLILSDESIFGIDLYKAEIGNKIEGMFAELSAGKGAVRNTLVKYLK